MYVIKKSLAVLLTLLLCVGILAMPAYAAGTSQDGVEVSLVTDKIVYDQGETIVATLTVINTNDVAVEDVSLESLVPEGYVPADGSKIVMQLDTLGAGEIVTLKVSFVPEQTEVPETPTTGEDTPPEDDTPVTGDHFAMGLWITLLLLAAIGLILVVAKCRLWKQALSLVLCMAMLASLVAGVPFEAFAAESDAKTINIGTIVQVAGEPIEVNAIVKFTLPEKPEPVVHTVSFELDYKDAPQIDAQQVAHGECAVQPEGVTREGYKFAYWCIKTVSGVKMVDLSQPITEDMTLYARWVREGANSEITYTTYYNVSFGIPSSYTEDDILATIMPDSQVIHEGALVYSLPTPYREGYSFVTWCSDSALAKPISTEATVTGDMVLYPLMVASNDPDAGMDTINYVADEDVTDLYHSVTVKAPSLQAVVDGIVWVDVAEGSAEIEFEITDNGDGTYTLTPKDGLVMGKTYQLRAMDREQLPENNNIADSYIRFFHNGERQSMDVRYYNIFTVREEVDNMKLANGIIFLPIDQVQGLDMDTASSLYTLQTEETGANRIDPNENEGTFTYTGSKMLTVGDIVAIYEGEPAVEEEYRTNKTVGSAKNTAFLKILAVDGDTYTYGSPDIFDTLYVPEVLPIPLAADTDGSADDNTITIADSHLDFRYFPVESCILDENTTADVGDFIAFYNGTVDNPSDISYVKITSIQSQDGFTTIVFEPANLDDIQTDVDSFVHNEVPTGLTEEEIIEMENQVIQQALDSGFAEDAAALAIQDKLGMDEAPVWGQAYTLTRSQAQAFGYDPEIEDVEIDAGTFVLMFTFDPPEVSAEITENLHRINTIKDGLGLRVAFGVYVGIGVEMVNVITGEVDQSFTLDLYVTMEQELAVGMNVTLDADVDLYLGFIPTDAWVSISVTFDIGTYTGVGVVAIGGTEKNYDKEYLWDKLVKNDGSNGAFTSAESLSDQLNSMLSQGDTSFFDQYKNEDGRSTLIAEYRNMLKREVDYVDILTVGPRKPIKLKIIPNVPVAEVAIDPQIVFSAKLNVVLGASAEFMDVKQYSYTLFISLSDGARAWANEPVNKQTPYHSLNLMMFGNIGIRGGVRLDLSIGIPVSGKDFLSKHFKLCNVGTMIEMGLYADLYGFGYYHYDKNRETGATNLQKAGAFYLETGFYMDIDIYAGAIMDLLSVTFHVLEMQVPFHKDTKREYIYNVGLMFDTQTLRSKTYDDRHWYTLDPRTFAVDSFDIKTGDLWRHTIPSSQFAVVIPEEYQHLIEYMEYDVNGNFRQAFWLKPDVDQQSLEIKLDIVLKAAMGHARADSLDSLYDLVDIPSDTMTIRWSRGAESTEIQYESSGPRIFGYGSHSYSMCPGDDYVTIATLTEGTAIPNLGSINHLAPEVPGMALSGWKVSCRNNEVLDGMFITDISELQGYTTTFHDIKLQPQYVPRDDTKYIVRHWITALDDPDDYEIFLEENLTGRTHSCVDALDLYLQDSAGMDIDYNKLPIQTTIYDNNGEAIYVDFDVMIRHDGSTAIDLYYKRDTCMVTVKANNPDFDYYGSVASTFTTKYSFGEAVIDPGYSQTEIPGYTFLGWSTTADGSSGIIDALPDSLDFTGAQQRSGIVYYAIWQPDTVMCRVNYYLLDEYGVYQFLDTEYHELAYGTELDTGNLKPMYTQIPEDAYGNYTEATFILDGVTYAYGKDHIYNTGGRTNINVYYARSFSKVYFDYVLDYHIRGDSIIMPEVEKTGYRFLGWKTNIYGDNTLYQAGQSLELTKREYFFTSVFVEADDVKYTVEHYQEQITGSYSEYPTDVQVLYGTTNSTVTPAPMEYTGFEIPVARQLTIKADGSAVLAYYYARKTFDIHIDYQIEGENIKLEGRYPSHYRYGVSFGLSDPYEYPLTLRREGYRVVGWYLADEELNPDQTLLPDDYWVTGDALYSEKELVFKPMWEKVPYEYHVEHYLEQLDGSYVLQQTDKLIAYFHDVVQAQPIQFTGFTFDSSNSANVISGTITPDETLTLKLYYSRNSYDAKWYDYDGVTLLATTQFKYGQTITIPEVTASREGYTFNGWNIGEVTMTTEGASFNAKDHGTWTANTYTVTFEANGGSGSMSAQTFTYDVVKALTANGFTRSGWTFNGWNTNSDGSGTAYADQAEVKNLAASGNVMLYAQWEEIPSVIYTVQHYFESVDGTAFVIDESKTQTFEAAVGTTVSASAITVAGFSFDADNGNNVLSASLSGNGDAVVLKLYYTRNSFTLTFDFNGESMKQAVLNEETYLMEIAGFEIADQTITLKYGQTLAEALTGIKVPVITQEGDWYWDEELQDFVYVDPVYEDVAFETAFTGYTFKEWTGLVDTMPAEDLTLTAEWTPIQITVTFNPGSYYWFDSNALLASVTQTFDYGSEIALPDYFALDGCTIAGWFFGESQGNYPMIVDWPMPLVYGYYDMFTEGTEVTIAPFWVTDGDVAQITFNGNGAEGSMDPLYFSSGSACGYLPRNKFVKKGYKFVGWNTAADGSGEFVGIDWFNLSEDTTLYAQWEPIE